MIKVEDVTKSFDGQEVLKGISSSFEPGQCNLIIGKSGSGKTVFIKCMVGLIEPTTGHVYYSDRDFSTMTEKERKNIRMEIGMLFQGNALFDSLTVEQNVRFPLDMFTNMTMKEKNDRVNFCLDRVELNGAHDKFPSEISGGMMKRVGIARAIVLKPKYLFCDEPNSGLDPKTAIVIDDLIKEITIEQGITTIVNTHDMNSVMNIGDKVLFLHNGKKHWEGSNTEILHATNEELEDFVFASKFLKEMRKGIQKIN